MRGAFFLPKEFHRHEMAFFTVSFFRFAVDPTNEDERRTCDEQDVCVHTGGATYDK